MKNGGVMRPILDLRPLNRALAKRTFKKFTMKQILAFIQQRLLHGGGLAYFHIQIASHHSLILRFAFEGFAYQLKVLLFGLPLAPRTFTKCMNAA